MAEVKKSTPTLDVGGLRRRTFAHRPPSEGLDAVVGDPAAEEERAPEPPAPPAAEAEAASRTAPVAATAEPAPLVAAQAPARTEVAIPGGRRPRLLPDGRIDRRSTRFKGRVVQLGVKVTEEANADLEAVRQAIPTGLLVDAVERSAAAYRRIVEAARLRGETPEAFLDRLLSRRGGAAG
jgi:hypothetical protein